MDSMLTGAIIGGAIGLIYAGLVMLKARNAKGARYLKQMTRRVIRLDAPFPPDVAMARLAGGVDGHPAVLEATDPATHRVVFTDKMTLTTFGFFYPIHISAAPGGGAELEIGIVSRGNQWGPLVTKAHQIFVAAVSRTLGLPGEP